MKFVAQSDRFINFFKKMFTGLEMVHGDSIFQICNDSIKSDDNPKLITWFFNIFNL